jgi:large subunit ribosomal protein L13Ae
MLPHKTARGDAALMKLRAVEGVPPPLDKVKRMVVPNALRVVRLNPRRKYCSVGRLSHEVGWKYQNVIETLELKRKAKASLRHAKQKRDEKLRAEAKKTVAAKLKKEAAILQSYGYNV